MTSSFLTEGKFDRELNPLQKKLCDEFVDEYLHDGSIIKAAMRLGFAREYAKQYGEELFYTSYVQKELRRREEALAELENKDQDKVNRKFVVQALRRMTEHAYPASQVAAAAKLASILGLNGPVRADINVNHMGGVIAVPAIADINDWEAKAVSSQERLVSDTNDNT